MKKHSLTSVLPLILILFSFSACNGDKKQLDETPTRGNIRIGVEESYKLLLDTEISTFQSLYTYAVIKPWYKPEADLVADLLADSVRMIVISRDLTKEEKDVLLTKSFVARSTKIAHDAVAFILNKDNPDEKLRYDQVEGIITGKITQWKQIDPSSKLGDILVVFDHNKSGNYRFLKEMFLKDQKPPENLYAVNNNAEVMNYVKGKTNAIGVIGLNWVSDTDDTISHQFLKEIKIAAIGQKGDTEGIGEFKKPFQGYLAEGSYPFSREVYGICRESFAGLGTGFVSFLAGDVGQRIILKSGLVPATMPVRLVEVKK